MTGRLSLLRHDCTRPVAVFDGQASHNVLSGRGWFQH